MAPRGRNKQKTASESGTSSVADSEDTESTSTRRTRRSRQPKRYYDDDYSPPPAKRRANRETPVSDAPCEEEEREMKLEAKTPSTSTRSQTAAATPATGGRGKPKGRPKKNPTPPRSSTTKTRRSRRAEEDVIYMDEDDSEEVDEDSDDEFMIHDDPVEELEEEMEEDLLLNSESKPNIDDEDSIFCPWADQDPATLPKLELPESSQDIPIARQHTMDAIEVYEILRSYHRTLRITPFTFEDFCAALISRNNSCIMAEVHMALLRVCMKSDDEEQTHYSVTETNNSVNIMMHHMDTLTYAEILRQYIEAYPYSDSSVIEAINVDNYPYVGYEAKLVVLLFMSYRFLYSSEFKKVVNNGGKFQNDENCRVCGKSSGRVIGCSQCEAAFHVECSQVKPFPEVLVCFICKKNDVKGVLPLDEPIDREPLRSQPIGRDRYGRLYWFMARRIFVTSLDETELHYYSTPPQLYQLLNALDRDYYERDLCEVIRQRIDELLEQMTLTMEMTSEKRDLAIEILMKKNQWTYEYAEQRLPQVYLHKDSRKRMASILQAVTDKSVKKEPKEEPEDPTPPGDSEVKEEGEEPKKEEETPKYEEDSILPETMLGIFNGELINTFWSGGTLQDILEKHFNYYLLLKLEPESLWRLGDVENDESFMAYYNYYFKNEMSESFLTRKKQTDKKKYMASKFATIESFDWVVAKDRLFYGNSMLHTKFVAWTLSKTARKIPADLMHRRWPEIVKLFDAEVTNADDYKKLGKCLLELDAAARRTIFMPQWWNGLGQTRLERITQEQREQFVKEQQRVKKLELEALSKDLDDSWIRVNYSKPKWPNTYILRQKGETYRNAGKGEMGGWMWVAKKYQTTSLPVPETPQCPLPVVCSEEEKMYKFSSNQKARHLDSIIVRIADYRDLKAAKLEAQLTKELSEPLVESKVSYKCYSPACRRIQQNIHCYSPACRQNQKRIKEMMDSKMDMDQEKKKLGVLGEDRAWPIPDIQKFSAREDGKRSLFVLQKRILRRLIVTAGCQQVYIPGFSTNIKSNLLIWPYPAPRPTLDLCWKWQTLNARNLHAIALQLRIMWSSIKWNEFEPDDNHPDRRVVIDTPNHDERRRIVRHKEMPPYGQYERYELEIEIIPLYEEQEAEDESWLSRGSRATDCSQKGASRVGRKTKRPRNIDNRVATSVRHEWVDGVTLKVFEIKDYWKGVRMEHERQVRRKLEAMKKAAKAKEDAERARQIALQRITAVPRTPAAANEKGNVPYVGRGSGSNRQTGYLERYNTSQLPPCPSDAPLLTPGYIPNSMDSIPSTSTPSSIPRVLPNPIRKVPAGSGSLPRPNQGEYGQQQQFHQRAAAGADYSGTPSAGYRVVPGVTRPSAAPQGRPYYPPGNRNANMPNQQRFSMPQYPPIQRPAYSNGQPNNPSTSYQNGGVRIVQEQQYQQMPQQQQQQPQRRVIVTPQNHHQNQQIRQQVAEEAYSANDQPPPIPRYDQQGGPPPRPQGNYQQPNQIVRSVAPGTAIGPYKKKFVYVKGQDGTPHLQQQRVVVRAAEDYPPGTVLPGPPAGPRLIQVRPSGQGGPQVVRQVVTPGGQTKYVRAVMKSGNGGPDVQVVRRVVPVQQQQHQMQMQQRQPDLMEHEYNNSAPSTSSQQPQTVRYIVQGSTQQRQHVPYQGGTVLTGYRPRPLPQEAPGAPEYPETCKEDEPMLQEQEQQQ